MYHKQRYFNRKMNNKTQTIKLTILRYVMQGRDSQTVKFTIRLNDTAKHLTQLNSTQQRTTDAGV